MVDTNSNPFAKGQLKREAADWFLKMRDPDAEQHRAEFENWLARGAMHRAAYNSIAQTYLIADGVNWDQLPPPRPVRGTVVRTRFAIAASVMLLAFFLWKFVGFPGMPYRDPLPEQATASREMPSQFVTRLGEIKRFTLPDGSSLTMDTDTLVSVDYRADERELRLEHGRARFEVAHERRPFVVEAGDSEVIARGTVFDVALVDAGDVRVSLLRGKVEVRRQRQQDRRREMVNVALLSPGEGVRIEDKVPRPRVTALKPEETSDWSSGSIDFGKSTLGAVVAVANRYSTTKIRLDSADLEAIPVSGVFRVTDPERLASSLSILFGLRINRQPSEIILSKPVK